MKLGKIKMSSIIFWAFIIFLFTPWGKVPRVYLIEGVTYVKTLIFSPKAEKIEDRIQVSNLKANLTGIHSSKNINLEEYKGKVIFLNYWATWCPPCIAEMSSIQKLYNDYKEKVTFVFITSDDKNKVDEFFTKNNYQLPTYHLSSNIAQEISARSLPTTFVIDKNGKIATKDVGAANWNSAKVRTMLDDLLSE